MTPIKFQFALFPGTFILTHSAEPGTFTPPSGASSGWSSDLFPCLQSSRTSAPHGRWAPGNPTSPVQSGPSTVFPPLSAPNQPPSPERAADELPRQFPPLHYLQSWTTTSYDVSPLCWTSSALLSRASLPTSTGLRPECWFWLDQKFWAFLPLEEWHLLISGKIVFCYKNRKKNISRNVVIKLQKMDLYH